MYGAGKGRYGVASCDIAAGELVLQVPPIAIVPNHDMLNALCAGCGDQLQPEKDVRSLSPSPSSFSSSGDCSSNLNASRKSNAFDRGAPSSLREEHGSSDTFDRRFEVASSTCQICKRCVYCSEKCRISDSFVHSMECSAFLQHVDELPDVLRAYYSPSLVVEIRLVFRVACAIVEWQKGDKQILGFSDFVAFLAQAICNVCLRNENERTKRKEHESEEREMEKTMEQQGKVEIDEGNLEHEEEEMETEKNKRGSLDDHQNPANEWKDKEKKS